MSDLPHSIKKSILLNGKESGEEELITVGDELCSQSSGHPDVKVIGEDYVELQWLDYSRVKRFILNSKSSTFKISVSSFKTSGWRQKT